MYNTHPASGDRRQMLALLILDWTATLKAVDAACNKITTFNLDRIIKCLTKYKV